MVDRRTWEEFRSEGFLWLANTFLHVFGWAIVVNVEEGKITDVFPARVKFRGFTSELNDTGYRAVSNYMVNNAQQLKEEAYEE